MTSYGNYVRLTWSWWSAVWADTDICQCINSPWYLYNSLIRFSVQVLCFTDAHYRWHANVESNAIANIPASKQVNNYFTSLSAQSLQNHGKRNPKPRLCPTIISNDIKGSLQWPYSVRPRFEPGTSRLQISHSPHDSAIGAGQQVEDVAPMLFNPCKAGSVFIRQNLLSADVIFWRIKTVPHRKN